MIFLLSQVNNDGILTLNQEVSEFYSGPFPLTYPVSVFSSLPLAVGDH